MILSCMSMLSRRLQVSVTFIQLGSKFCMSGSALDTFAGCNQNIVAANCCQQAKSMPLLGDPLACDSKLITCSV